MQIDLQTILKVTNGKLFNSEINFDNLQINNVLTDSRVDLTNSLFVALKGEIFDAHNFLSKAVASNASALCINSDFQSSELEEFKIPIIMVNDTLLAYQNIANYHRHSIKDLIVVGVTGSVGKTSSKEILRTIGEAKFGKAGTLYTIGNTNNQVGVPQNLLRLNENHKIAIIEMGTNHFGEILPLSLCANPNISIINSIAPCHLENLLNLEGVAKEKSDIFRGTKTGGLALISSEAPCQNIMVEVAKESDLAVQFYGSIENKKLNSISANYIYGDLDRSQFELVDAQNNIIKVNWQLTGAHQANNAAAACLVGKILGLSDCEIATALSQATLTGMRMKKSQYNEVTYINDAYNANPLSMRATLNSLADTIKNSKSFLVLGDMLELGEHTILEHYKILEFVQNSFPKTRVIAVGPIMKSAKKMLNLSDNSNMSFVENSELAYNILKDELTPKSLVFLKGSRGMKLENAIDAEAR